MLPAKVIKKHEKVGLKHCKDPEASMEYLNSSIDEHNPVKKQKVLIVFVDRIVDTISNEKPHSVVTDIFVRGRELNISLVYITQSFFRLPKYVRLNVAHFFIMKILNKQEFQQIAINHSSDTDFDQENVLQNNNHFWLLILIFRYALSFQKNLVEEV